MPSKLFHVSYSFWGNWTWSSRIVILCMHFLTCSFHYLRSEVLTAITIFWDVILCSIVLSSIPFWAQNLYWREIRFLLLNCCMCLFWSKIVSAVKQVGIAQRVYWQVTSCTAWVRFPAVQDYPVLHSIQTGSGAQPASYPVGIRGSFHRVKWQGHEADYSPPF
jgi:hypothetical protein